MLKLRIASALVLAAVVATAVIYLPAAGLAAFFLLLALVAAYEWAKLAGVATRAGWLAYATALSALATALWLTPALWPIALAVAAGFWIAAFVVACRYPASDALLRSKPMVLAAGMVALVGAWLALVALKLNAGAGFVIWLLVATTMADAGAYFAGRRFGRRKLAPQVSPGKTWEGLIGGASTTLAWGACGAWFFSGPLSAWLGVAAVLFVAAVAGDLFESALKRSRGVKDSGKALPGHGGALDRIDSVLAAAPVFALLHPL